MKDLYPLLCVGLPNHRATMDRLLPSNIQHGAPHCDISSTIATLMIKLEGVMRSFKYKDRRRGRGCAKLRAGELMTSCTLYEGPRRGTGSSYLVTMEALSDWSVRWLSYAPVGRG